MYVCRANGWSSRRTVKHGGKYQCLGSILFFEGRQSVSVEWDVFVCRVEERACDGLSSMACLRSDDPSHG